MATTHQSGFTGSLTFVAGPSSLVSSIAPLTLQKWSLAQETGVVSAFAKGDTWKTKFPTVNRWSADVECLVSDGVTPATQLITGQTITTAKFILNGTAAVPTDYLQGNGKITSLVVDDPLDGPVVARIKILGDGILTPVTA